MYRFYSLFFPLHLNLFRRFFASQKLFYWFKTFLPFQIKYLQFCIIYLKWEFLTSLGAWIEECTSCFNCHRSDCTIGDLCAWVPSASITANKCGKIYTLNFPRQSFPSFWSFQHLIESLKKHFYAEQWYDAFEMVVAFAYRHVSSLCELCRRKFLHRIISSVVLWRRKPRDINISSVVDCRLIAGRGAHSVIGNGGGARAHGLGSLQIKIKIKIED